MPKSELEAKIDKATNENNVSEDWGLILDICDHINHSNNKKEIIKIFVKKLNDKDPHVIEHTITLLNACVSNCDRSFKIEVSSRIFVEELRNFIVKKRYEKLSRAMANAIEKWTKEPEFKNDPGLNLIPTLYNELKRQGVVEFGNDPIQASSSKVMKQELLDRKEEEELEKAIQLSLKESQAKAGGGGGKSSTSAAASNSPFGQLIQNTQSVSDAFASKQPNSSGSRRRVKALYDFEAAEDNEITFKAGDILVLSDDSDQNWWKGFDVTGTEGLFPSNFVTFDLNEKIEVFESKGSSMSKKVSFNDNINVNLIPDAPAAPKTITIDEKKIDECIEMLQNADPTGEIQPDSQELLDLEEDCYMMGPLIDKKLQDIDEQHAELEDLNLKILEAFQLYNNLMKESISKQTVLINNSQIGGPPAPGSISFSGAPPSLDANSLNFANKLNSMVSGAGASSGPGLNIGAYAAPQINPAAMGLLPGGGIAAPFPGQYLGAAANGGLMGSQQVAPSTNGNATNGQPQMASYGNFN